MKHEIQSSQWRIIAGDILDVRADVLICSANIHLNLSGGVGGAILLRYGDEMQTWLHNSLKQSGRRTAAPGDVVVAPPCGTPYRAVLHAVAVDGAYQTLRERIRKLIDDSLLLAVGMNVVSVALTALGTGFGRMTMQEFGTAIEDLVRRPYGSLAQITIVVRHDHEAAELAAAMKLPR